MTDGIHIQVNGEVRAWRAGGTVADLLRDFVAETDAVVESPKAHGEFSPGRRGRFELEQQLVVPVVDPPTFAPRQFPARVGIPFFHVPSVSGADKSVSENKIVDLITGNADLVVLARYMQILSKGFLEKVGVPVINIHHSFLPAFIGAGPYTKAKERGVKLIGATAHYVTEELDEGPIIEQDVAHVDQALTPASLIRFGSVVESRVLARAVRLHVEHRILLNGHRTVVFR